MKRFATVVAAALLGSALVAGVPAGAEPPQPTSVDAPGYTYTYRATEPAPPRPSPSGSGPAGSAGTEGSVVDRPGSASARPPGASAFVPPRNDDFVFRFAPDVSASKRTAFEAAAGVWSEVLEVEVPIEVEVATEAFADPGVLGGAAPGDLFANDPSFPVVDTWYVSGLANQFAGRDMDPRRPEIDVLISSEYDFYEGVDGRVPANKISLLALALHELGHGLGHTTLAHQLRDGSGTVRYQGLPLAYDRLAMTAARVPLLFLGAAEAGRALTQPTYWAGAEGAKANGGSAPQLYAPATFHVGSSLSHIDESRYTTALMTPFLAEGEAQTAVPPLTQAMFADFGWGLEARSLSEAFTTALSRDFVKRFPTPTEMRAQAQRLDTGAVSRHRLAREYALSDEWVGTVVDSYYLTTLGRSADSGGKAHWSAKLRSGTSSAVVAANFFASTEYFRRAGGTTSAWVRELYLGILGREPDPAGANGWVNAAANGMPRATIAAAIYQAPESRAKRVTELYRALLGRDPDRGGLVHWTDVLRNGRDIELAVTLASSPEYRDRAFRRFG